VTKRPGTALATAGIVLLGLAAAGAAGYYATIGSTLMVGAVLAPLAFAAVLTLRLEWLAWVLLFTCTIVSGGAAYFLGIGMAQWLPTALGLVLYVVFMLRLITLKRGESASLPPFLLLSGAAFIVLAVVTTLWSGGSLFQWIYGVRFYLALGAVMLVFAMLPMSPELIRRLWIALLVVVALQFPVAIYQYFVVAGGRASIGAEGDAWDAVVGTMGGNQEGGGLSAAMGFFVVSGFAVVFAMWKRGLIGTGRMVLFATCVLGSIFLAEVKAMVVVLPLAVALVLREQLLARIKLLLMGASVVTLLVFAMPFAYSNLHYERSGRSEMSFTDFYAKIIAGTDSEHVNAANNQMGRVTQLVFWWEQHSALERPKEFFLGHGIASTNLSRLGVGDVARKYFPLSVSNTTGGLMLWEVGLVGLGLSVLALAGSAVMSLRLSKDSRVPEFHRAALEGGAVVLAVLIPALFYKHFALKSGAVQFVLFFCVGQMCYWHARVAALAATERRRRAAEGGVPWVPRYASR
jgi:hypothetical protein